MGELLTRAYLAGVPTSRAIWTHVAASLDHHQNPPGHEVVLKLLGSSVAHPLAIWAPRDPAHTREVLTWLTNQWQERGWPVPQEFQPEGGLRGAPELFYKTYQGLSGRDVTLLESGGGITHNTTGLTSWCGSAVLAEWALNNPRVVDGRRVLELGAGMGLAACVLMNSSNPPNAYIATDCHHHVLSLLHHNLALNLTTSPPSREELEVFQKKMSEEVGRDEMEPGHIQQWLTPYNDDTNSNHTLQRDQQYNTSHNLASIAMVGCDVSEHAGEVGVMQLDWRAPSNIPPVDVVLAADVVYDRPLIPPLVAIIRSILDGSAWEQQKADAKKTTPVTEGSKKYPTDSVANCENDADVRKENKSEGSRVKILEKENNEEFWSVINDCEEKTKVNPSAQDNNNEENDSVINDCEEKTEVNQYAQENNNEENDSKEESTEQMLNPCNLEGTGKREAYLACTRRSQETISVFLSEVAKQGLVAKLVYQNCLDTDTALFVYNETHHPVKVYRLTL